MKLKNNTGVALFVYNRPSHFRRVLIALENYKIEELNVFLDGPKNNKDKILQKEIKLTLKRNKYNKSINFKVNYSNKNKGLAKSIMQGLDKLSKRYENILILEDDCVPRKELFYFINKKIKLLRNKNYAAICGYQLPEIHKKSKKKIDTLILKYFVSWGWCVKSSYWKEYRKQYKFFKKNKIKDVLIKKINKLILNKNNVWTIDFIKFNNLQKKKYIFPSMSLIKNIGFDGSGVNSKVTDKLNSIYANSKKITNKNIFNSFYVNLQKKILEKRIRYFF
tara:strand:- start:52 stop:885 length:834 start_codon:yes stop_codon:yes gene_type:complete